MHYTEKRWWSSDVAGVIILQAPLSSSSTCYEEGKN